MSPKKILPFSFMFFLFIFTASALAEDCSPVQYESMGTSGTYKCNWDETKKGSCKVISVTAGIETCTGDNWWDNGADVVFRVDGNSIKKGCVERDYKTDEVCGGVSFLVRKKWDVYSVDVGHTAILQHGKPLDATVSWNFGYGGKSNPCLLESSPDTRNPTLGINIQKCCPSGYKYDSSNDRCVEICTKDADCGVCGKDTPIGVGECTSAKEGRIGTCNPFTDQCKWDPCQTNPDCGPNYCCDTTTAGGPGGRGQCKEVGWSDGQYICVSHSPGSWAKCDENNLDVWEEINRDNYKCVYENEEYKWIISPKPENGSSGNFLSKILNFLRELFG